MSPQRAACDLLEAAEAHCPPGTVGYAHMASLVCKWLQQTENPMRTPGANDVPQDEAYFLKASSFLTLPRMPWTANFWLHIFERSSMSISRYMPNDQSISSE